ncbi:MAG: hypothetical protein IKU61_07150, partial [Clostridia bacterium]|nr:hypothetical protein [Clostridia bacterium]
MKKNRIIRFGLLIIGFLFFANPNISIFDILPDCIGCLFVVAAIFKLADISEWVGEAKRAFYVLFWINLSKLPATVLLMWMTGSSVGEDAMWLLFAFCYAIAEVIFGIRAFSLLFEAFAYVGTRRDGGNVMFAMLTRPEKTLKRGGKEKIRPAKYLRLESVARFTTVFIILRTVLCTLPEFALLSSHDSLGYVTPEGMALYRFRPMLVAIGAIITLVIGIIWFARIAKYTVHLSRNSEFFGGLYDEYLSVAKTRVGIFAIRRTYIFAALATAAAFFSVDFYLDEINYIPDFLAAIFLFAAACAIANQVGGAKLLKAASVCYFVTSSVTFVTMIRFVSQYPYSAVHKIARAKELYIPYAVSNAVTQIAFILSFFALAAVIMRVVRAHTGINTVTGVSNSSKPLVKVYSGRAVRLRIVTLLAGVMSSLY